MKQQEIDLIAHCIEHMSNNELVKDFFANKGIKCRKTITYKQLKELFIANEKLFSIEEVRDFFRNNWKSTDIDGHIKNLKSGLLVGHSWHGAMPSMLHRSLQDKVRACVDGNFKLEEIINIGADIMRHEYFIVATHDILESSIIQAYPKTIPPIGSKSITDYVFNGVPVDLKVSAYPDAWVGKAGNLSVAEKQQLAIELYEGADKDRIRKQAAKTLHNWGLNRMYVLVKDQSMWLTEPERLRDNLIERLKTEGSFRIKVHKIDIECFLIEL